MPKPEFDNDAHELFLAERYERLAKFQAFDELVDLALDGVITMDQALIGFIEETRESKEPPL